MWEMIECQQSSATRFHVFQSMLSLVLTAQDYCDSFWHRNAAVLWSWSHQTQQPEDHIEDLRFWEQVLSKLNTRQGLQEGYRPVN